MEDKQEAILDAIYYLEEARNNLVSIGGHENDADVLDDIIRDLNGDLEVVSEKLHQEDQQNERAMLRDYWNDVL